MRTSLKVFRLFLFLIISNSVFAQRGKDGAYSGGGVINIYKSLTTNATSGTNSVTINNTAGIAIGDLIMIIQMQGATINSATNTINWGAVTAYNGAGSYEFAEVAGITGNMLSFCNAYTLKNNYQSAGKAQVIRVPRYTSLTVTGTLTAQAWDGNTGGVVAAEVSGNIVVNGTIDVSGQGFRGGSLVNDNNSVNAIPAFGFYASTDGFQGAEKGEGIFGYQAAYDGLGPVGGRYCRGAGANGGGGGNQHNAGGGGGANAGDVTKWTGNGNPDNTDPQWASAWNLEGAGFAASTSSGGGRGGYTWAEFAANPFTNAPGSAAWGGQQRYNVGGLGGRPLDYSTGRIFLGGGGGAGDQNNGFGGTGGNGGGIVYLSACGTVSGGGRILANGANGKDGFGDAIDAPGGAGAGGVVVINAGGNISVSAINSDGGVGGNQVFPAANNTAFSTPAETEGPGGGGGGGYVSLTASTTIPTVRGGANGVSNRWFLNYNTSPDAAHPVYPFPANGATKGGDGIVSAPVTQLPTVNTQTICSGGTATLTASSNVDWYDAQTGGNLLKSLSNTFTSPALTATTTYYIDICPKLCAGQRIPAVVTVNPVPVLTSTNPAPVCAPQTIDITASPNVWDDTNPLTKGTGTISYWTNPATTTALVNPNSVVTSGKYYIKKSNGACTDTASVSVIINTPPILSVTDPAAVCSPLTVDITPTPQVWKDNNPLTSGSGAISYWTEAATTASLVNPTAITTTGKYYVKKTNANCTDTAVVNVTINAVPVLTSANPAPVCAPQTIDITPTPNVWDDTNLSTKGAGTVTYWTDPATTSALVNPNAVATSGKYYIKKSNGSCTDTASVNVIINTAPVLKVTDPSAVCVPLTVDITPMPLVWDDTNPLTKGTGTISYWTNATTTTSLANPTTIATSGKYYIKKVNAGCSDTAVVNVSVNAIPVLAVTDPAPVCEPSKVNITLSPAVWSDANPLTNGAGIVTYWNDMNTSNPLASPNTVGSSGKYYIKKMNGACVDTASVNVTIKPTPVLKIKDPSSVCVPATIDITQSPTVWEDTNPATKGLGTIAYWTNSAATTTLNNPGTVVNSGTYYITQVNGLCSDTIPVNVVINSMPVLSVTDPAPVCFPLTADITKSPEVWNDINPLTSSSGITTYWTDPTTLIPLGNSGAVNKSGTFYIKKANGVCIDTAIVNVVVNPAPILDVADPAAVCEPNTVDITLSPVVWRDTNPFTNSSGAITYWIDATTTTSLNIPDAVAQTGKYYIRKTNGVCTDTASVNVTINSTPVLSVTDPAPVCFPLTVDVTKSPQVWNDINTFTNSSGSVTYWNDSQTTIILNNPDKIGTSGTYIIKKSNGNCTDTAVVNVTINPTPVLKIVDPQPACVPDVVNVTVSPSVWDDINPITKGTGTVTYWNDVSTSVILNAPALIKTTGKYYIKKENGLCADIKSVNVEINDVHPDVSDDVPICKGESAVLTATGGDKYIWSTDEVNSEIKVAPSKTTRYTVRVYFKNCSKEDSVHVIVRNENPTAFFIPNAFTPNDDGENEIFKVVPRETISEFRGEIYSRWGEMYYVWSDVTQGWDGKLNGNVVQEDVYVYIIKSKTECTKGETAPIRGTVSVVK